MTRPNAPRRRRPPILPHAAACALLLATLIAAGCGAPGGTREPADRSPGYPPEPGPDRFPGLAYPAASGPIPKPGTLTGPVWLIGVDGATWTIIRPMAERGELPVLHEMMEKGASSVLMSEEPTISPAVWTTIATGMPRYIHGIRNFRVKLPASYRVVQVGPPDRRAPALWELVGSAGGRSAVVNWFGSFPAEKIAGSYVSKGFDPEHPKASQVEPPDLAAALETHEKVVMRRGDLEKIGWNEDYRRTLVEDARVPAALRVILDRDHPDFVALYFAGTDVVQHVTWGYMDPKSRAFPDENPPDKDLAGVIPAYYQYIDHTIGQLREMAPAGTTFVIVSDHGGGPMRREEAFVPDLPRLLDEMGLMKGETGELFTMSQPYRNEKPIWLNIEGAEPSGSIPPEQAPAKAGVIRERLLGLRTGSGDPVFASVRDLTGTDGWRPGDPALSVRFAYAARSASVIVDGVRRIDAKSFVFRLPGVTGSHRPEGILIMQGPGIRAGALDGKASIYQVAPTVLYLLGLPQDARMLAAAPRGGGVLEAAIDPDLLARHPVRMIPAYPGTDRRPLLRAGTAAGARTRPVDPSAAQEMEKLKSLGYVH